MSFYIVFSSSCYDGNFFLIWYNWTQRPPEQPSNPVTTGLAASSPMDAYLPNNNISENALTPYKRGFCATLAYWQKVTSVRPQKNSKALVASTSEFCAFVWDCIKCGVLIFGTKKKIFYSRSIAPIIASGFLIFVIAQSTFTTK